MTSLGAVLLWDDREQRGGDRQKWRHATVREIAKLLTRGNGRDIGIEVRLVG